ncbi:MAG: hypothetical protein M1812_006365 [Candelaria pacifica]|nr:MAG: hypothetical protein M1812_006365 [Candelaria pacifica]
MVLGLLAIAAIPTTIGVWQSVEEGKKAKKEAADTRRMEKFNLEVYCDNSSSVAREIHGKFVVLRRNKLYIDDKPPPPVPSSPSPPSTTTTPPLPPPPPPPGPKSHLLSAFYIAYPPLDPSTPSSPIRGLVSTISHNPPMLNWIYADTNTGEMKFGNRTQSRDHLFGSWDWTVPDLEGVLLGGREGWLGVEEEEEEGEGEGEVDGEEGGEGGEGDEVGDKEGKERGERKEKEKKKRKVWAVYFDHNSDRLKSLKNARSGRRILEISLERKVEEG